MNGKLPERHQRPVAGQRRVSASGSRHGLHGNRPAVAARWVEHRVRPARWRMGLRLQRLHGRQGRSRVRRTHHRCRGGRRDGRLGWPGGGPDPPLGDRSGPGADNGQLDGERRGDRLAGWPLRARRLEPAHRGRVAGGRRCRRPRLAPGGRPPRAARAEPAGSGRGSELGPPGPLGGPGGRDQHRPRHGELVRGRSDDRRPGPGHRPLDDVVRRRRDRRSRQRGTTDGWRLLRVGARSRRCRLVLRRLHPQRQRRGSRGALSTGRHGDRSGRCRPVHRLRRLRRTAGPSPVHVGPAEPPADVVRPPDGFDAHGQGAGRGRDVRSAGRRGRRGPRRRVVDRPTGDGQDPAATGHGRQPGWDEAVRDRHRSHRRGARRLGRRVRLRHQRRRAGPDRALAPERGLHLARR